MKNHIHDLAKLVQLTEAAYTAEQSVMASLKRHESDLRAKFEALRPSVQSLVPEMADDAARRAGADVRWQFWAEGRRSTLNAEIALNLVAQSQARKTLAKAFGRCEAIKAVLRDEMAEAKAKAVRRAERR